MFAILVLPFVLAIFIAYLIFPSVDRFEKVGLKRNIAIIFVYVLFISIAGVMLTLFLPYINSNINEVVNTLPIIATEYKNKVELVSNTIGNIGFSDEIKNMLLAEINKSIKNFESHALTTIKKFLVDSIGFLPAIFGLFVSLILAYYYVKDIQIFKNVCYSFTPIKYRNDITIIATEINMILKKFIQGHILVAIIVGVIEIIALMAIGVKFPFFLGIIGGAANIIPYFGPFLGSIPALIIAMSQSTSTAIWTAVMFVTVQQVDNAFISPKIVEGKLGIHPVATIFIVIAGGEMFGMFGMFLAVPVVASLKVIVKRVIERIV